MRLVRAPPVGAARWNRGAPDVPVRAEESLADALLGFLTQLLGVVLTRLPQAREKASHMHIYDQMRQLSIQRLTRYTYRVKIYRARWRGSQNAMVSALGHSSSPARQGGTGRARKGGRCVNWVRLPAARDERSGCSRTCRRFAPSTATVARAASGANSREGRKIGAGSGLSDLGGARISLRQRRATR